MLSPTLFIQQLEYVEGCDHLYSNQYHILMMSQPNLMLKSQSDIAYIRALRKAQVFQQLTDSTTSNEFADDVFVELGKGEEEGARLEPILAEAKQILSTVNEIMAFELNEEELYVSSTTVNPIEEFTGVYLSDAAFKFWFVVLLICFLFISVGIFHFFCIGQKNVTRRNSLDKHSREATETTTMEMISEEIEMDEEDDGMGEPNRMMIQEF
ncbi:hypothetical protein L5515_007516 [Caenorhabditis briggsae]|uniref:Uncharacterized protein n=1 Tax=Caenorhabditis briggsae TaxID=6238 RepID=A0AAE9JJJ9_CAEBR|nr:hypothetical protein L5515_007516 [Caenorhabditis briggsae]